MPLLCHKKNQPKTNQFTSVRSNPANSRARYSFRMAGIRARSGPPGKWNAFRHGLAALRSALLTVFSIHRIVYSRRNSVRLARRQGGESADQQGHAYPLAEIIASDVSLLVTFKHAIDGVIIGSEPNSTRRKHMKACWCTQSSSAAAPATINAAKLTPQSDLLTLDDVHAYWTRHRRRPRRFHFFTCLPSGPAPSSSIPHRSLTRILWRIHFLLQQ